MRRFGYISICLRNDFLNPWLSLIIAQDLNTSGRPCQEWLRRVEELCLRHDACHFALSWYNTYSSVQFRDNTNFLTKKKITTFRSVFNEPLFKVTSFIPFLPRECTLFYKCTLSTSLLSWCKNESLWCYR